jgi:hypothetical protein
VNPNRIGHSPFDWGSSPRDRLNYQLDGIRLLPKRRRDKRQPGFAVRGLPPDSDYRFKLPFYAAMPAPSKGWSLISRAMR